MEIKTLYKVISGSSAEVENVLNILSRDGWRPVTMACHGHPVVLTVILENKIMDEAKLDVSDVIRTGELDDSTVEEVQ